MKRILLLSALSPLLFAATSCSNVSPADNARLGALTSLAVSYAEAKGKITPADAAAIRQAQTIILTPIPAAAPPQAKQPGGVSLQP